MIKSIGSRRVVMTFGAMLLLLAAGVFIDLALLKPQLAEVRRLEAERTSLLSRIDELAASSQEGHTMARALGRENLAGLMDEGMQQEAVSYIGQVLGNTRLNRLELTTTKTKEAGKFRQTQVSLRVLGRFSQILNFVKALEEGHRLISVDGLVIEEILGTRDLEGRLSLSVYDPLTRK